MANEVKPYYEPGKHLTGYVTAAAGVTGRRFVQVDADAADWSPEGLQTVTSGPTVNVPIEPAAAAVRALGVAQRDAAQDKEVTVMREGVLPVEAGAAITANSEVEVDGTARAVPLAAGIAVGLALNGAAAAGDIVAVALYS